MNSKLLVLFSTLFLFSCNKGGEKTCNPNKLKDNNFCDTREGKVYKYTNINGKIWMAENLKYGKRTKTDAKYSWTDALKLPSGYNEKSYYDTKQIRSRQGICPKGWHIPNDNELNDLISSSEDEFSIWSATQNSAKKANIYSTENGEEDLKINSTLKSSRHAVRCVKNYDNTIKIANTSPSASTDNKKLSEENAKIAYKSYECQTMDLNSSSSLTAEEMQLQENIKINDLEYLETIYTSTFNNAPEVIRNVVTNIGSKTHRVTFQYWLNNGFSDMVILTKDIPPKQSVAFEPNKELNLTKEAFAIKNETKTTLQICAYGIDGRKIPLLEQSKRIKLLPPQFFTWQKPEYIAAFATYQMDSIPALQKEIAQKIGSIIGYQQEGKQAETQVKAAYEIIANREWHYLSSFSMSVGQKVRYPIEIMREKSANCIEGTLLLSAILESLGIRTGIVLVPNHAFLAWKSNPNGEFDKFIETTMAFNQKTPASYEQAAQYGIQQYNKHLKNKSLEKIIDIKKMWNSGISLNEVL